MILHILLSFAHAFYSSPSSDGHDFFFLRDAGSDVSGSWLSQTSLVRSNTSFSNQFDLAGTYKNHRLQSSIVMLGSDGNLRGVGPFIIGDKFLLKDINSQKSGLALFSDIVIPFHITSTNEEDIYQPFGLHVGLAYEVTPLKLGHTLINIGFQQDIAKNPFSDMRNTGLYTKLGQGLWTKTSESNAQHALSVESIFSQNINSSQGYTELLTGFSYLYDTSGEFQLRLGAFFNTTSNNQNSFEGALQLTWNTGEEMGRRIPKWEILETRCTLPDAANCPDSDEDGISDFFDLCPVHSEIVNNYQDDDGCPEYGVAANIDQIYTEIYRDETLVYQSQEIGAQTYEEQAYSDLMSKSNEASSSQSDKEDTKTDNISTPTEQDIASQQMKVALEIVVADLEYISETLDHDKDGINDISDLCRHRPEDKDNFEDLDGCPDEDNDQDGVFDNQDQCPLFFGDAPYGCPDEDFRTKDTDLDGVPNSKDYCPDEKETINAFEDNDGCPDSIPEKLNTLLGRMDSIQFEIGSSAIKEGSVVILEKIGQAMQMYPDYNIRVEGHTDDIGTKESNDALSQDRAQSVVTWLIDHNISSERLEAKGFGSSKPLASNNTSEGQLRNRRVEIYMYKKPELPQ